MSQDSRASFRVVLVEPDQAGNVGAIIRLCACLDVAVVLIEPLGFVFDPVRLRRVTLDYAARARIERCPSWSAFLRAGGNATGETALSSQARLIALTTRGETFHTEATFRPGDQILVGSESAGLPDVAHEAADLRIRIPMASGCRSLNVVSAVALVLGEGLRQTGGFADLARSRPGC